MVFAAMLRGAGFPRGKLHFHRWVLLSHLELAGPAPRHFLAGGNIFFAQSKRLVKPSAFNRRRELKPSQPLTLWGVGGGRGGGG